MEKLAAEKRADVQPSVTRDSCSAGLETLCRTPWNRQLLQFL